METFAGVADWPDGVLVVPAALVSGVLSPDGVTPARGVGGFVGLGEPVGVFLLFFGPPPTDAAPPGRPPVRAPVTLLMVRLICPAMPASGFGAPVFGVDVDPLAPLPDVPGAEDEPVEPEPDDEPEPEPEPDDEPDELPPEGLLCVLPPEAPPLEPDPRPDPPDPLLCEDPEFPCEFPPECESASATARLGPPTSRVTLIKLDAAVRRRCEVTGNSPPSPSGPPYRTAIARKGICCSVN